MTVGLGLQAPAAVPVEMRVGQRRVFRLSRSVGEDAVCLARPAPFEVGQPVEIRLRLPEDQETLELMAEVVPLGDDGEREGAAGCAGLLLVDAHPESREALGAYVARRLALMPLR